MMSMTGWPKGWFGYKVVVVIVLLATCSPVDGFFDGLGVVVVGRVPVVDGGLGRTGVEVT